MLLKQKSAANPPTRKFISPLLILAILLLLSACNMPGGGSEPTDSAVGLIYTAAAQTVQARTSQVVPLTQVPPGAGTPLPPGSPTQTPGANTPQSPETTDAAPASACDRAEFVEDVTVPDNTQLASGAAFVKTWRLENAGTCTWTTAYSVVFESGDSMGAPASLPITTESVEPGDTIDISVPLKAPEAEGEYQANFMLRNAENQEFGVGEESNPFWVQVRVGASGGTISGITYDFIARAAAAEWSSGAGSADTALSFGGAATDASGSAAVVDQVTLENGSQSGKVLLAVPMNANNGVVQGVFPAYTVQNGDELQARLGFMAPNGSCQGANAVFEIQAREGDQTQSLGQWEKSCNRSLLPISVNLSSLQGRSVQFVFIVRANGSPTADLAVWNSALVQN